MAAQVAALPPLTEGPGVPMPQAYTFLNGGKLVTDVNITVENAIKQVLHWIVFHPEDARNALVDNAFGSYDDVKVLTEKYISTMATNFSGRTSATGRIYFGTRRIKYLKAFTHWIRDFYPTSGLPTIVGLSAIVFKSQLGPRCRSI